MLSIQSEKSALHGLGLDVSRHNSKGSQGLTNDEQFAARSSNEFGTPYSRSNTANACL